VIRKGFPPITRRVGIFPDMAGPRDDYVRVVLLSSAEGGNTAKGILWNYACHPVCFPERQRVSSEFPGFVRARIRENLGFNVPVVFWQGFAGNIRPLVIDESTSLKSRLHRVMKGTAFGTFDIGGWQEWCSRLSDAVLDTIKRGIKRIEKGALKMRRCEHPLIYLLEGELDGAILALHYVAFGEHIVVVGISAEPFAEYSSALTGIFGDSEVIPVGFIDGVFGYLPTSEDLSDGGYEIEDAKKIFGLKGKFREDISARVAAALYELQDKASDAGVY
jgi:hypothetical protein